MKVDLDTFPRWQKMADEHWKEFCPKMYQAYQTAGKLKYKLAEAATMTYLEVDALENQGFSAHEAWEMTREKYILLPPEPEVMDEWEMDD